MAIDHKLDYLRKYGRHLQSIVRGNFIISLYWSDGLVFEVFILRNNNEVFEIKCFDQNEYAGRMG
jgi:hypothetical protein